MLRFNQNNLLHPPIQYSLESYEPIELRPEEEKQNNQFIKMAFLNKSPNRTKNIIPNIININNISNYNTQVSINKKINFDDSLNDNSLYNNNHKNFYTFGNLVNTKPVPVLNPAKINPMPSKTINDIKFSKPISKQNSFNIIKKVNIPILNYQNIQPQPQLIRTKSSKYISPIKTNQIMHKNTMNGMNLNKIFLPMKINHLSPTRIMHKNTFKSSKQVIPIYRKIVMRRKNLY